MKNGIQLEIFAGNFIVCWYPLPHKIHWIFLWQFSMFSHVWNSQHNTFLYDGDTYLQWILFWNRLQIKLSNGFPGLPIPWWGFQHGCCTGNASVHWQPDTGSSPSPCCSFHCSQRSAKVRHCCGGKFRYILQDNLQIFCLNMKDGKCRYSDIWKKKYNEYIYNTLSLLGLHIIMTN